MAAPMTESHEALRVVWSGDRRRRRNARVRVRLLVAAGLVLPRVLKRSV
jgi:hypothetical protein